MTTNRPRQRLRAALSGQERGRWDAQCADLALTTIGDILHVVGRPVGLAMHPTAYSIEFVMQIDGVTITITPVSPEGYAPQTLVRLETEGHDPIVLESLPNGGELPVGELNRLVTYLHEAQVAVPELRFKTLPPYARLQLLEGCSEHAPSVQLEQRPRLSVVPRPAAPLRSVNQPTVRPSVPPGNQRNYASTR